MLISINCSILESRSPRILYLKIGISWRNYYKKGYLLLMKILVTGGAGFIGSHIVDQSIAAGHQVAVVDNLWEEGGGKNTNLNPQARFFRVDITDEDSLNKIFDSVQPEVVCHQAAQHSVAVSTKNPKLDARVNVLGLLNILTNCSRLGVRKIIFASSGATYGTPARLPIDEEVEQRPESPYGITKMVAEHYLRYWKEAYGLAYTALRYGNVYGPRQDPNGEAGVIAIFAKRFLNQETIRIDWDGEQQKDYVYVEDVARAVLDEVPAQREKQRRPRQCHRRARCARGCRRVDARPDQSDRPVSVRA